MYFRGQGEKLSPSRESPRLGKGKTNNIMKYNYIVKMWIGFSQGETDTKAVAVKGTVREKQGKWKKFSHPQRPFSISSVSGLRERTKWIKTQLGNQTLVQMVCCACIDHVTLTGQTWFQFFSEIIMKLMLPAIESCSEHSLYIQLLIGGTQLIFMTVIIFLKDAFESV